MRKMVIIPYEQYLHLVQDQLSTTYSGEDKSTAVNINHNKDVTPYTSTYLKQNIDLQDTSQQNSTSNIVSNLVQFDSNEKNDSTIGSDSSQDQSSQRLSDSMILCPFGKNQLKNAEALLSYVRMCMDWNEKGELMVGGELVPGSHVTDLLRDCLSRFHKKTLPIGAGIFYANLQNAPLSLIYNVHRHPLVGKGLKLSSIKKVNRAPPPPGLPVSKKSISLESDTIHSWSKNWKSR